MGKHVATEADYTAPIHHFHSANNPRRHLIASGNRGRSSDSRNNRRTRAVGLPRRHFFKRSSAQLVMPTMPVRMVTSATGRNLLECSDGNGGAPGFLDWAITSGATAPTLNMNAGIE